MLTLKTIPVHVIRILTFLIIAQSALISQPLTVVSDYKWPDAGYESRPWTRWWWLGGAVDSSGIRRQLEAFREAGLGGVEITPIYGVKGEEENNIPFLSPRWLSMLQYTVQQAKRLDLGVDIATGTGWPFGGPHIEPAHAAKLVLFETYRLDTGEELRTPIACSDQRFAKVARLILVIGVSDSGLSFDLTDNINSEGRLNWSPQNDSWHVTAMFVAGTGQKVKRAAPGGEGLVIDHFAADALAAYLIPFKEKLSTQTNIRAFFNDSYEVYGANWTDTMFSEFSNRRDYDLSSLLYALAGEAATELTARVKYDFRLTISEMLLENFTQTWVNWGHAMGSRIRNQAHGSPGNLLDLYSSVDIPETEIFGPSRFKIPGLRTDNDFPFGDRTPPDPLMMKFASSAAALTGKKLVSAESATWLGEHFKVALSQIKPEIDQLFIGGVNHVFYHGTPYSPERARWPGWQFYASVQIAPDNSIWRDLGTLNKYITRCQTYLQNSRPAHDILIYFPIHDLWQHPDGLLEQLTVHNLDEWLYGTPFHNLSNTLWQQGFTFDYISDRLLERLEFEDGNLDIAGSTYKTIVVPECEFMPLHTLEHLVALAESGATIIFSGTLPRDVPGLSKLADRKKRLRIIHNYIGIEPTEVSENQELLIESGRFIITENVSTVLSRNGISRESMVDKGLQFLRKKDGDDYRYFITNLGNKTVRDWISLAVSAKHVIILDPMHGQWGLAATRADGSKGSEIYIRLTPGESLLLQTENTDVSTKPWDYFEAVVGGIVLGAGWNVEFVTGGPAKPDDAELGKLISWTDLPDSLAGIFAGTARYRLNFELEHCNADDWLLRLGEVYESARIFLNGKHVSTLIAHPFEIRVGNFLNSGDNELVIEVTNLSANRIADMDRRGINWKRFHDINFVNINYKPFDASDWPPMVSGLLGPVQLMPLKRVNPL